MSLSNCSAIRVRSRQIVCTHSDQVNGAKLFKLNQLTRKKSWFAQNVTKPLSSKCCWSYFLINTNFLEGFLIWGSLVLFKLKHTQPTVLGRWSFFRSPEYPETSFSSTGNLSVGHGTAGGHTASPCRSFSTAEPTRCLLLAVMELAVDIGRERNAAVTVV